MAYIYRRVNENEKIEHYRKVLQCCRENGIEPIVTMHHFSSPKWLIEKGGWEAETTIKYFTDYCRYVIEQLGDEINYVCTLNEANMGLQLAAIMESYMKIMQAAEEKKNEGAGTELEGQVQVGLNYFFRQWKAGESCRMV